MLTILSNIYLKYNINNIHIYRLQDPLFSIKNYFFSFTQKHLATQKYSENTGTKCSFNFILVMKAEKDYLFIFTFNVTYFNIPIIIFFYFIFFTGESKIHFFEQTCSFSLHKTLIDGLKSCGL